MKDITLDNLVFNPSYLGFKFGTECNLKKLREGHIYMKNLDYFIQLENKTGCSGINDKDEAILFSSKSAKFYDVNTNELLFIGKVRARNKEDIYKPIFCMTIKDIYKCPISYNNSELITRLSFDKKLLRDFSDSDYVMIITDVNEFFSRIQVALTQRGLQFKKGFVKYRNTDGAYKTENGIEFNDAFCKKSCFKHQEEYRILLDTKVDDHYEFNIGNIAKITVIVPSKSIIMNGIKLLSTNLELTEIKV